MDYADKDWLARVGEDDVEKWFSVVSTFLLRLTLMFITLEVLLNLDSLIPIIMNASGEL